MRVPVSSYRRVRSLSLISLAAVVMMGGAGCSTVGVHQQRLVSKPNMQFSRSVIYSYSARIGRQIQPGLAMTGGAQPSSCTVCR